MSVTTQTYPSLSGGAAADDEQDHLYCCDETLALCGADLSEWGESMDPADFDAPCPLCEVIDDLDEPCGAEGCPV